MKKIVILLMLSSILLSACTPVSLRKIADGTGSLSNVTRVEPSYIDEKFANGDTFIFFAALSTCTHCVFLKKVYKLVVTDNHFPIFYIERDKVSNSAWSTMLKYIIDPEYFPIIYVVKDGVVAKVFFAEAFITSEDETLINQYAVDFINYLKTLEYPLP
jgi:hypothetical protein